MEETKFKTDYWQHGNDKKKPSGRLSIYATKINFICLDLQKKEVLVKVSPIGFRLFKAGTEFVHSLFNTLRCEGSLLI